MGEADDRPVRRRRRRAGSPGSAARVLPRGRRRPVDPAEPLREQAVGGILDAGQRREVARARRGGPSPWAEYAAGVRGGRRGGRTRIIGVEGRPHRGRPRTRRARPWRTRTASARSSARRRPRSTTRSRPRWPGVDDGARAGLVRGHRDPGHLADAVRTPRDHPDGSPRGLPTGDPSRSRWCRAAHHVNHPEVGAQEPAHHLEPAMRLVPTAHRPKHQRLAPAASPRDGHRGWRPTAHHATHPAVGAGLVAG